MQNTFEFDHEQVRRYLLENGWTKENEPVVGVSEQFSKNKKIVSLVVEPSFPSYSEYLKDSVRSISILENEKFEFLIQKIEWAGSHRFRVTVDEGKAGHRIRLPESRKLRDCISDMLLAVSHSALSPSINHPRLSKRDAVDLHSEMLEDQTGRASYIANFLIPDIRVENLSGEMVVDKIGTAMKAAAKIAEREVLPAPDEYEMLAKEGVSANFLNSLAELKGIGTSDSLKFQLDDKPALSLSSDHLSNLKDFYSEITSPANKTVTVEGKVIAISASPECTATTECDLEGARKIVKIKITPDQYKLIVDEEHRIVSTSVDLTNRPHVRVTGILRTRSRGRREIVEMTNFEIVDGQ